MPHYTRPPREGTRVRFEPNPASLALYTHAPERGEEGRVTTVSFGMGSRTYMPGPGGGLLYVEWDQSGMQGVSLHDVVPAGGRGGARRAPWGSTASLMGQHRMKKIGAMMHHWHGSQGDPVYAVGSYYYSGKAHPSLETTERALSNVEMLLAHDRSPQDRAELEEIKAFLKQEIAGWQRRPNPVGRSPRAHHFPAGARVLVDGRDEAIVAQAFPEGSTSFMFPHYKVHFIGGDRNVAVAMKRVGVERAPVRRCPHGGYRDECEQCLAYEQGIRDADDPDYDTREENPAGAPYYSTLHRPSGMSDAEWEEMKEREELDRIRAYRERLEGISERGRRHETRQGNPHEGHPHAGRGHEDRCSVCGRRAHPGYKCYSYPHCEACGYSHVGYTCEGLPRSGHGPRRIGPPRVGNPHEHGNPSLSSAVQRAVAQNPDLGRPHGLSPAGNRAYDAIVTFLVKHKKTYTGGGKAFYSPEEWQQRGEDYSYNSELVVVYDGGDLGPVFSMDHGIDESYRSLEAMQAVLAKLGLYAQEGTGWYSGIYVDETGAVEDVRAPSRKRRASRKKPETAGKRKASRKAPKKTRRANPAKASKTVRDKSVHPALRPLAKKTLGGKACYQPSCFPKPKPQHVALAGRAPLALPPRHRGAR